LSTRDEIRYNVFIFFLSRNISQSLSIPPHNINRLSQVYSEFLQWLSGFTDSEGNFLISPDAKGNVAFRFRIRLHKDDLSALEYIKYMLGVGIIRIEGDSAIYIISKLKDLIEIIIPLFSTYPLLSTKHLDFESFKQALDIKNKTNTSKLILEDLNSIIDIKSNMNRNRIVIESTLSEMTLSNIRSSTK